MARTAPYDHRRANEGVDPLARETAFARATEAVEKALEILFTSLRAHPRFPALLHRMNLS